MVNNDYIKQPKTKKGQETFNRIVEAGAKQFHTLTYPVTTVADIAKEAKVATGTFYLYFESKQNLFRYLILSYHHEIRKEIAKATKNCTSRKEIERLGFETYFQYIFKNPYAYTIIWQSLMVDKELFIYYYTSFAERYVLGINESMSKNEINSDLNPEIIAYSLMGITNFVGLKLSIFDKPKPSQEQINSAVNEVMKILSEGLFK